MSLIAASVVHTKRSTTVVTVVAVCRSWLLDPAEPTIAPKGNRPYLWPTNAGTRDDDVRPAAVAAVPSRLWLLARWPPLWRLLLLGWLLTPSR